MLDTDLPYLEPLLLWLRKDAKLSEYFTEKSFFMPHNDLVSATSEAMKKDCPAPRALWILPQDTIAIQQTPPNCKYTGNHTFYIQIMVQCIRDAFQLSKIEDEIKLTGQFMELMQIRKYVKKSVAAFQLDYEKKNTTIRLFDSIGWRGDQMLYPNEENSFLITTVQYQVKIY